MENSQALLTHPYGLLALMMLVPVFYLNLERWTQWKIFDYFPPVIWIFITPIFLSNFKLIPMSAPVYKDFKSFAVPMFIILMLLDVDLRSAARVALRSIGVLIFGAFGVVIGGMVGFLLLKSQLDPDAWRGFGALAGSWIGGTGNLAAVAEAVETPETMVGIVVIADNLVFLAYFPLLFMAKKFSAGFGRFAGVRDEDHQKMEEAVSQLKEKSDHVEFRDVLTLFGVGFVLIWIVEFLSGYLPEMKGVFSAKTWQILILTTVALILATTPLRKVPGTKALSMALVYVYLAMIGAGANIAEAAAAPYFLVAGFLCIIVHLAMCVLAAKLFRVPLPMAAIASIACIGGAASTPVVAGFYRKELVPVGILLALVGYALGNYLGILAAHGCRLMLAL